MTRAQRSDNFSAGSSFASSGVSDKFQGMIELSLAKRVTQGLAEVFNYVGQTAPPMFGLRSFMSLWRILQYFGNTFVPRYTRFWGEDTSMYMLANVLSVFSHIIPGLVREEVGVYFLFAFAGLFFAAYVFIGWAAYYFSENQKLPHFVPTTISLFFGTIGYMLPPVAVCLASEEMGRMISNSEHVSAARIVSILVACLMLAVHLWVFGTIYSVTILFKPDSLQVVVPSVQMYVIFAGLFIDFLVGLASELSLWPQVALTAIAAIWCFFAITFLFQKGGLVNRMHEKALGASSCAEGILLLVVVGFEVAGIEGTEIVIFIVAAVWIGSYAGFHWFFEHRTTRFLEMLDAIEDDPDNFQMITSSTQFEGIAVVGFRFAHPVCLSWQLFKIGIEKWPTDVNVWLLFAKMTAVLPEETQQLNWISLGMVQNGVNGRLAKHIHHQIHSILRQREANLVPELKGKLDRVAKEVQHAKHKIRYIWDLILQGNINELEVVMSRAFHAIDHCEAEFLHLLRQFPNSRFVARAYARFLRDVVADHGQHKTWAQNVTLLQRGIPIVPDQAHSLGIRAFPLLPVSADRQISVQQTGGMVTDDALTQTIEADDEQSAIDAELRMSVRDSINRLVIPSIRDAKVLRIVLFTLLFFVPVVVLTVYLPVFVDGMLEPLEIMYTLADVRTILLQLVGIGFHFVCERAGLIQRPLQYEPPGASFGGSYNSSKQVEYLVFRLSTIISDIGHLTSFQEGNPSMEHARKLVFTDSVDFNVILNYSQPRPDVIKVSLTRVLMEYAVLLQELISLGDRDNPDNYSDGFPVDTIFEMKYVSIPFNNIQQVTENISTVVSLMNTFVQDTNMATNKITLIALIVIMVAIPLLYVAVVFYLIHEISSDKMVIYKCLASLPKHVVSRVADCFKMLKKDEDDEEIATLRADKDLNRQEENILKVFATSTDTGEGRATDSVVITICTIVLEADFLLAVGLLITRIRSMSTELADSAPHIDNIMGSYTYDFSSLIVLIMLGASFSGHQVYGFPHDEMVAVIEKWSQRGDDAWSQSRFGDPSNGVVPFVGFASGITLPALPEDCNSVMIPGDHHDCYRCWSAALLFAYHQVNVARFVERHLHFYGGTEADRANFSLNDEMLNEMWHLHTDHLYELYFVPVFSQIISRIETVAKDSLASITVITWILFLLGLIIELSLIGELSTSGQHSKFAFRLLLQCPGHVVVSNTHITTLLQGNFHEKSIDSTTRDAEFYDVIVKDLPDSVITADPEGVILTANRATQRIFQIPPEDLIGHTLNEFGARLQPPNLFPANTANAQDLSFEQSACVVDEAGVETHVEIVCSTLSGNIIVTSRDVTQRVMYNRLISDEKNKSDRLLSSILPERLVKRVQDGEKNISFSVQSATILFLDIVGFTPWCSTLPASTVMQTLNLLFLDFDELIQLHSATMTRIKCIGDCYMAAGGIFMEVNQPSVHAKDVVDFGLDTIQAIERRNVEINQTLQIRVGINTGGPIVAGVLGTAKPTFEIIGPAINMAQQMEHHGIPMQVHISRAVYELIYGGSFAVKERGEVQLKNGSAVTYLVEKRLTDLGK
jgi:PAS domain S-box-containing protein